MSDVMTTREALVRGMERIANPADWISGHARDAGRVCAVAAIRENGGAECVWKDACAALCVAVGLAPWPDPGLTFGYDFNDAPGRTHRDVIRAFTKAIVNEAPPEPPDPEDLHVPESWLTVAA